MGRVKQGSEKQMRPELNQVQVIGNLTQDTRFKVLDNGTSSCRFSIAINKKLKGGKESTVFIRILTYGDLADVCNDNLTKGDEILVIGYLVFRTYYKQSVLMSVHEIEAKSVQFLGGLK